MTRLAHDNALLTVLLNVFLKVVWFCNNYHVFLFKLWYVAGAVEFNRLLLGYYKNMLLEKCVAHLDCLRMPLARQLNILPLHKYITLSVC